MVTSIIVGTIALKLVFDGYKLSKIRNCNNQQPPQYSPENERFSFN